MSRRVAAGYAPHEAQNCLSYSTSLRCQTDSSTLLSMFAIISSDCALRVIWPFVRWRLSSQLASAPPWWDGENRSWGAGVGPKLQLYAVVAAVVAAYAACCSLSHDPSFVLFIGLQLLLLMQLLLLLLLLLMPSAAAATPTPTPPLPLLLLLLLLVFVWWGSQIHASTTQSRG